MTASPPLGCALCRRISLQGVTNTNCLQAPHQMMAWCGLERYGYIEEAQRVAYRWLFMCVAYHHRSGAILTLTTG